MKQDHTSRIIQQTSQSSCRCMCVCPAPDKTNPVYQPVFGLTQNKSHSLTWCVFRRLNDKTRGKRKQPHEVVNYKSRPATSAWCEKKDKERQRALNMHNNTLRHRCRFIKPIFITMGVCRPEIWSTPAETGGNIIADKKSCLCLVRSG